MLDNYFYNESECLNFMSAAPNKGFNVMTNLFVEQIREYKNQRKMSHNQAFRHIWCNQNNR